ncbi:SacI homology domain-containing protein [Melampsora americana]|nr:SacI homology domain-containing protein [Melampsora americana]
MNSNREITILHSHLSIYLTSHTIIIKPGQLNETEPTKVASLEYHPNSSIKIIEKWNESTHNQSHPNETLIKAEFDGLVGILKLFHDSYLIFISSHSLSGSFKAFENKNIYRITQVIGLPLNYDRATKILKEYLKQRSSVDSSFNLNPNLLIGIQSESDESSNSDSSSFTPSPPEADEDEDSPKVIIHSLPKDDPIPSTLSANTQKISLGRLFWKLKSNRLRSSMSSHITKEEASTASEHHQPSSSIPTSSADPVLNTSESITSSSQDDSKNESKTHDSSSRLTLDLKILKELSAELSHGGMYYALDWDITHRLQVQSKNVSFDVAGSSSSNPSGDSNEKDESFKTNSQVNQYLYQQADHRFWWNKEMIKPFLQAGFDSLIYVIIQGYVESSMIYLPISTSSSSSSVDPNSDITPDLHPIEFGIISRRSIERHGLRYQRRGVDTNGSTANFVETEFLMASINKDDKMSKDQIWSFVQIRGSIPLFWNQTPWALKPPPLLEGSENENLDALRKHFITQTDRYGDILIVCLAEKTGNEGKLVNEYERQIQVLNDQSSNELKSNVKYFGWDFHKECKGMHYEKISNLIDETLDELLKQGYFSSSGKSQTGVIRTSCIDCLDRTNVVQARFSKHILNQFIVHLGLAHHPTPSSSPSHDGGMENSFNEMWANNGDQISKQYAGTSALKGDFVRTGKRDWRGIVNDATNSVARMWLNSMTDFFKQTVLDYALGVHFSTFSQFQDSLNVKDPGQLLRLSKVRSIAIETASQYVLPEGESKISGWSLLTPLQPNTKQCPEGLIERVVLLSDQAIYVVHYDFGLQKVEEFTRIGLDDIIKIEKGVYITSVLEESEKDEKENYGFIIYYDLMGMKKKKTDSLGNEELNEISNESEEMIVERMISFKVIKSSITQNQPNEKNCEEIGLEILNLMESVNETLKDKMVLKSILSLEEVEKFTTFFSRVTRGVKHLIW